MQMNNVIAVWGNPNSGKTTISIKLAGELAKRKRNVIVIGCDVGTPVISTILPFKETKDQSFGKLLSAVQVTQESILKKLIPFADNKYLSILSYQHGENERTYAKYSKERVIDLFILLKHLADHIIIDCSSQFTNDIFSNAALELSDRVIRVISPDLKAMSYYDSVLTLMSERKYNVEKHYKILSNVKPEMPKDIIANKFGGIDSELPYAKELELQWLEARLFEDLVDKKSKSYSSEIKHIVDLVIADNKEKPNKVKQEKQSMKGLFKKRGEE